MAQQFKIISKNMIAFFLKQSLNVYKQVKWLACNVMSIYLSMFMFMFIFIFIYFNVFVCVGCLCA